MTGRTFTALAVCLGAVLLTGCAARHRSPGLSDRLIKQGKPSIEMGPPLATAPKESLESYIARVRKLAAAARPASTGSFANSVESRTPALMAALLRARAIPTAENYRLLGEAYVEVGVLDTAHQYLSRAVRLDPTDARAFDDLARIWRSWGYPNLGLGDAYRAIYYAPESPEAYNTLGTLLQAVGQRRPARQAYQRALTLDASAAYALNNLCYLSVLEGKAASALGECESALQINPNVAVTRNNLGLAYASLGELQSAHREFSRNARPAAAAYNLGIVELATGHYADAAEAFDVALAADSNLRLAAVRATQARRLAAAAHTTEESTDDRN